MDNINSSTDPKTSDSPADDANSSSFDLESMDPEQRQKVEEELRTELAKVSVDPPIFAHDSLSLQQKLTDLCTTTCSYNLIA